LVLAKLGGVEIGGGRPVAIVGAINLSRDSFYKGSIVRGKGVALRIAREMVEQGAVILDVGAMATGPRSVAITPKKEMRILLPVIRSLSRRLDVPISADTQRAEVARAAIEAGADIVNDISGLKADARMGETIAKAGCSALLMAARKLPGDVYEIGEINDALRESLRLCRGAGIPLKRVIVDPAIGHWPARLARLSQVKDKKLSGGKYAPATLADLGILARLREVKVGRPICVGISRKSFVGEVLGLKSPQDRLVGSLAASVIAVQNGAHALRTHDPKETIQAVRIAEAIRGAVR